MQKTQKTIGRLYAIRENAQKYIKNSVCGKTKKITKTYRATYTYSGSQFEIKAINLFAFCGRIDQIIQELLGNKTNKKPEITIGKAFNMFLDNYRKPKLADYSKEKQERYEKEDFRVLNGIAQFFQIKKAIYISEIKSLNISELIEYFRNKKISNSSINRYIAKFRAVYNYIDSLENYNTEKINFIKFKLIEPSPKTNYLSKQECQKIIECSASHLKPILQFYFWTRARKQNALNLKWIDIDFENKIITIKQKGNRQHILGISDNLFELLEKLKLTAKFEYVFEYKGKRIKDIKTSFNKALQRANIILPKGQKIHITRHTTATQLVNAGEDIGVIRDILGHSSITMTQKYAHVNKKTTIQALNKIGNNIKDK